MTFGVALEVLRKQYNCWEKITECSANCEECECHVDASDLVEAVRTVLDNFPTQMSETSGKDTNVLSNNSSFIKFPFECPVCGAKYEGNVSDTNVGNIKFKPGSKFLLEIGEKRIGLDEYSIVGTDLYVWGSMLEKLTPYEPNGDAISKQAAIDVAVETADEWDGGYSSTRAYMITNAINKIVPSVQAEQKKGHWIPVDDPSITGRCSVCGFESHLCEDDVYGYDYCPNCGARLEVVDE